jgi:cytochrome c-type biogenesis protein CcmH/NrfG
MRQAAELEVATPKHSVTPGPTLPAYELLGDLYMEQKKPKEALAAYQQSLQLYPRRFNSVLGAATAARAAGDKANARAFYSQLIELAAPESPRMAVKEAQQYLAKR